MRKSRFSDEQIIAILREQEAGRPTAEVCRKHGISDATFHKWKSKYGGMEVSDAKRLKALEDENRRLKKLLAEQMCALVKTAKPYAPPARVRRLALTLPPKMPPSDAASDPVTGTLGAAGC